MKRQGSVRDQGNCASIDLKHIWGFGRSVHGMRLFGSPLSKKKKSEDYLDRKTFQISDEKGDYFLYFLRKVCVQCQICDESGNVE